MTMTNRKVNSATIELIKHFESLHDGDLTVIGLQPKMDPIGIWTVGYGHALRWSKGGFLRGDADKKEAYRRYGAMTIEEAENLLDSDVDKFANIVERLVKVELTDNQFGALVSLAFNIGQWNFSKSTLLRLLNKGDFNGAANQFLLWRKAQGKILRGLVLRREAEKKLFLTGQYYAIPSNS